MRSFFFNAIATAFFLCCTSVSYATCTLSTDQHPSGVVGLQLFYPDDPLSWTWADELKVPWVRIELRWDWLEPKQGVFDWKYTDAVMALAATHNIKALLLFNHVPGWILGQRDAIPERAANAISQLAQRHSKRVNAWEIFNEVNLPGYGWPDAWETPQESAAIYADTLTRASSAIRSIDKHAFVISAGLPPQNNPEPFARIIVQLTPPECYDAIGLHPYGLEGKFAAVNANAATLLKQENKPPKPVWFTEYGTSDNSQRTNLIRILATEKNAVPLTIFFTEKDIGQFSDSYGLRYKNGKEKPDSNEFKKLNTATHF